MASFFRMWRLLRGRLKSSGNIAETSLIPFRLGTRPKPFKCSAFQGPIDPFLRWPMAVKSIPVRIRPHS